MNWTFSDETNEGHMSVRSLGAEDIDVVFQPIVEVASGSLFAVEALVRCRHPAYAAPPVLFDNAVVQKACGPLGRKIREVTFERCGDLPVFVNIHPHELSSRWLVRPDDPLAFHSREVYLEITESAAFTYFDLCMDVLKDVCRRTGAHLVVDDYGAGFSNIQRILDLMPSVVKLDGSMVRNVDKDPRRRRMLQHIIELCRDLDAKVVAECVETLDELKAVIDAGADYVQGYLLARPACPSPEHVWPLAKPEPRASQQIGRVIPRAAQGTLLARAPAKPKRDPSRRPPSRTTHRKPTAK